MKITDYYLKKPHLVLSVVFLLSAVGIIGYLKMPFNLFPDVDRPQVSVITVMPGAAAADIEADISRTIEKELSTLDLVRKVNSVSKDEVSVVTAEFEYEKGLDAAATDVATALGKASARLPKEIRPPQIFKISQATQPVMTLSLSPADGSPADLKKIREFADNRIKEELLRNPGIANVEVFGGQQPEIQVAIDPARLQHYGIGMGEVLGALSAQNQNIPQGLVIRREGQYIFKTEGQVRAPSELNDLVIGKREDGIVHLRDVARVKLGVQEPQSAYRGNGREAIGINILKSQTGRTLDTIDAAEKALPGLVSEYPFIKFEVSYSQKDLIKRSVDNMLEALRDAVVITILVIFLFLANVRTMALVAISIPFTYLITFAFMWLFGFEFHMVTLTGVILAVGMLLDDAIVVIENIERHYHHAKMDLHDIVAGGTEEVMLAIFSGTYATVVVLVPIIFIGGYVQTVLRPLALSLSIALIASYIVSVTIIPIFAPSILKRQAKPNRLEAVLKKWSDAGIGAVRDFFAGSLEFAIRHRVAFILVALVILIGTNKFIKPLIGQNIMPPMDTGIVKINFESDANSSLGQTQDLLQRMEEVIKKQEGLVAISSVIGSEPSVVSFGSGKNPQQGNITVNLIDRFHRKQTIWEIENKMREGFTNIPELKSVDVFDYGATPLSSIRATVDTMVTGPDWKVLNAIGLDVKKRLEGAGGLKSVSLSWAAEKKEISFLPDRDKCALYGISPREIASQVQAAVQGGGASLFRVPGEDGFLIRARLEQKHRENARQMESLHVHSPLGEIPLSALGRITESYVPTLLTRQGMVNSIDVYGYREKAPVSHIMENVGKSLKDVALPPGYQISQEGDAKQAKESFEALMVALAIALVLLYFSLVPAFNSFIHPLTIMSAIPFALIGAMWSLLIVGKQQSLAAFMGVILLAGIVVKNSILLIDFIETAKERGATTLDALRESVRVRTRPILMTAFATAVGMIPIALERAIGLERLSPLAVVAIGGLIISTFLTLIYVPIFYTVFEDGITWVKGAQPDPDESRGEKEAGSIRKINWRIFDE
ncbi:MAG TPA: efflux RND transporter permease subunit [Geobacteraceae bacterium]|nr:efflux RND transporter permease subunit [Geobacteraceae bacterium]